MTASSSLASCASCVRIFVDMDVEAHASCSLENVSSHDVTSARIFAGSALSVAERLLHHNMMDCIFSTVFE